MRILATSRITPSATPDRLKATLAEEIAVGKRLYAEGMILQAYVDQSLTRTFMLLEAPGIEAARAAFAAYPQVREGLIAFEFVPLVGMPAIEQVHVENRTPLPAWWPSDIPPAPVPGPASR